MSVCPWVLPTGFRHAEEHPAVRGAGAPARPALPLPTRLQVCLSGRGAVLRRLRGKHPGAGTTHQPDAHPALPNGPLHLAESQLQWHDGPAAPDAVRQPHFRYRPRHL